LHTDDFRTAGDASSAVLFCALPHRLAPSCVEPTLD